MSGNLPADAAPLEPVPDQGSPSGKAATELVPTTTTVETKPIGFGRPLSIRILSMYAGQAEHRKLLVSSAVRSHAVYDAAPRAMHYVFDDVPTDRLLKPSPTQNGSRFVYYSPAALDSVLDLELRFSFDDFDLDKVTKYLDVAASVAALPIFAVGTSLGGPAGAAGGKALLFYAKKVLTFAFDAIDGFIDYKNDWAPTWTISLDPRGGLEPSQPGYVLLYGDGEPAEVLAPVNGDLKDYQLLARSKAYRVDTRNGTVVYADQPDQIVLEEPYVLCYVNGAAEEELEGWKAAAVTAALTEKFFDQGGPNAGDLEELLTGFNDMYMARKYAEISKKMKGKQLSVAERKKFQAQRDAYLKNIQSDDVKHLVSEEKKVSPG